MKRRIVAVAVALTVFASGIAAAQHQDVADPDDVPGPLDVRRVEMFGTTFNPGWKISTYRRWTNQRIWDRGFLLVFLDTFGDSAWDYYALVRSRGDTLEALLFRDRKTKRDYVVRRLTRWRSDLKSVSLRIPLTDIRFPDSRTYYMWRVKTLDNDACRRVCIDEVPDTRRMREVVREEPPVPTG